MCIVVQLIVSPESMMDSILLLYDQPLFNDYHGILIFSLAKDVHYTECFRIIQTNFLVYSIVSFVHFCL